MPSADRTSRTARRHPGASHRPRTAAQALACARACSGALRACARQQDQRGDGSARGKRRVTSHKPRSRGFTSFARSRFARSGTGSRQRSNATNRLAQRARPTVAASSHRCELDLQLRVSDPAPSPKLRDTTPPVVSSQARTRCSVSGWATRMTSGGRCCAMHPCLAAPCLRRRRLVSGARSQSASRRCLRFESVRSLCWMSWRGSG